MKPSIALNGLTKRIGSFQLGPLTLNIHPGQVTSLIGPNGAGKTTLMKCITRIYKSDSGSAEICGVEVTDTTHKWKEHFGHVGELNSFYENWSVEKNLSFAAKFYSNFSMDYAKEICEQSDLPLQKKVSDLSTGDRKKAALVRALAYRPPVLILDEPLVSLDPLVKSEIQDIMRAQIEENNTAIFISTHVLNELSHFADRLIFLLDGKLLADEITADLEATWGQFVIKRVSVPAHQIPGFVSSQSVGEDVELISKDRQTTHDWLTAQKTTILTSNRLGIEEIGRHLLKRGQND